MPDWIKDVVTAGPAVIFAAMWWMERQERREIMKESLMAMIETKTALQALSSILAPHAGGRS